MIDRHTRRHRAALAVVLACAAPLGAEASGGVDAPALVARYRAGDPGAARALAGAVASGMRWPPAPCGGWADCEAAAVLGLDAASVLIAGRREGQADGLIRETASQVSRLAPGFAFDWLLGAGSLLQAYGRHDRAFGLHMRAIDLRPNDPDALLGRATALEFSALPDGFGAIAVADRDVWPFIEAGSDPPSGLSQRLADPKSTDSSRWRLLEVLTGQYRSILLLDPGRPEARLRLGRVLEARGHRTAAEAELQAVASGAADRLATAVARLCLARFERSPGRAAEAYRRALEVDPVLPQAWLGLGLALRAGGDRAAAVAAIERALSPAENAPLSAWVEYHLGRGRAFPAAIAALRYRVQRR
jgi:tetratricopeptide (TPR) repeat protein